MALDLRKRAALARDWMFDAAFPLWAKNGVDSRNGFHEALNFAGAPVIAETSRVRVQARQTYSFALAKSLGWSAERSDELIAHGLDALTRNCRRVDGLYGRVMLQAGGLQDDTAELYDTAFALLAFAWSSDAGHKDARRAGLDVSRAIERHLKRPERNNGYYEVLPGAEDRNQNPHMHLLEASFAEAAFLDEDVAKHRIGEIVELVQTRFLSPSGMLRERFNGSWGAHAEDHFEVGHQYEWVWLLHQVKGQHRVHARETAAALYKKAHRLTGRDGALFLEHGLDGAVRDGRQRCWSATEALKAHLVMYEHGDMDAKNAAIECFDRMWTMHIVGSIEGGWQDCFDQSGMFLSADIPASTGYHIFLAFAELLRVADLK